MYFNNEAFTPKKVFPLLKRDFERHTREKWLKKQKSRKKEMYMMSIMCKLMKSEAFPYSIHVSSWPVAVAECRNA